MAEDRASTADDRIGAALDSLATLVLEARDLDEVLAGILKTVSEAIRLDTAQIALRDGHHLHVKATHGLDETQFGMRVGEGFAGLVAFRGEPVGITDATRDPCVMSDALRQRGVKGLYGVPLVRRGHTLGVLCIGSVHLARFAPDDEHLLQALAPRASAALALHSAKADALQRARQQAAVSELGRIAISAPAVEALLDRATELVAETLGAPLVSVSELMHDRTFVPRALVGWPAEARGRPVLSLSDESQARVTIETHQPVVVHDYAAEKRFAFPGFIRDQKVRSGISVAIQTGDAEPFGVLTAHSTQAFAFRALEVDFLRSVADIIATALIRAEERQQALAADETLRLAAEAAALGTWDWSVVTGELQWSDQTKRIYGLAVDAPVTYERYASMLPPEDLRLLEGEVQRALDPKGTRSFHAEHKIVRSDGVQRWLLAYGRAFFDDENHPVRVLGTTMDVTERRRAADDAWLLARASVELSSSLEAADIISRLPHLLSPDRGDLAFVDLVSADGGFDRVAVAHADPADTPIAKAMLRRYPGSVPEQSSVRPGAEYFAAASGSSSCLTAPLLARGRAMGAITVCKKSGAFDESDIALLEELARRAAVAIDNARLYSEANAARAHAEQQREEAQRANRTKDEFLAMLGHELRNPLAPIATAVKLLSPRLPGSRELSIVDRQVKHLSRLVDDLLDVSRITAGRVQLELSVVDVDNVIARAIETASPLIEQRRHVLAVSRTGDPLRVRGDATRLSQVVSNLLTNAAKYTPPGGHIEVRTTRDGPNVVVSVRDDGVGIAPDLLPRVFDLFTQGRQSLDRGVGGLGLGLAIVRSLVQMHGGTVEVRSEGLGRGAELIVRLPAFEGDEQPASSEHRVSGLAPNRALVFLVDDNADAAELLAIALESGGFEVRTFHDGPSVISAIDHARSSHGAAHEVPAIAVLDIGLPVMDGYELAAELRRRVPDLRLVAVTGYGQREDRERSRAAGFDAHLVKPVDLDVLEQTLTRLLPRDETVERISR